MIGRTYYVEKSRIENLKYSNLNNSSFELVDHRPLYYDILTAEETSLKVLDMVR